MAQRCYGPRDTRISDTQETNTVMEPHDTRENPLGPKTRRALGMRVKVWWPKEEEKQLCPSRCLRNYCSCSVTAPSGEGASGSFHLQHHKWVDRRRRSVVSDFAGNWVLNIFLWKKFFWVSSAGVRNQDSLSAICWSVWRAPKSRGETKLKVSQSQVAESRLGSTLPASNSRKG
jgi:hypothetical protein